jgi:AcrR family transcriptional regulator
MAASARRMSTRAAQAERTRQQIIETAQRLFAEIGYDATSLQMIADEMGLTKAAVYYYFPAKSDILAEAMSPGIQRLGALLDEAAALRGRRARTEHLVDGFADFLVRNRHAVIASVDPAVSKHPADAAALEMRDRAMTLMFGDQPAPAERLAVNAVFLLPKSLPGVVDLADEELREALRATMLRILRVPSESAKLGACGNRPG